MKLSELGISSRNISRAGIIPYIVTSKNVYFALGVSVFGNDMITDFGGGIEIIDGYREDIVETAIREYNEECYDAFDLQLSYDSVIEYNPIVMYSGKGRSVDLFINLGFADPDLICSNFLSLVEEQDPKKREIKEIIWMSDKCISVNKKKANSKNSREQFSSSFVEFYYKVGYELIALCSTPSFIKELMMSESFGD